MKKWGEVKAERKKLRVIGYETRLGLGGIKRKKPLSVGQELLR
jgi:hypothetical protein